jgi:branched-chain amino acid transport system permease protein
MTELSENARRLRRHRLNASLESGQGSILRSSRVCLIVGLPALVCLVALTNNAAVRYALIMGLIYSIAILGNSVITGGLGEISLAASAWMALGAYGTAYLIETGFSPGLAVASAVAISTVMGALVAIPTVRLDGLFTALVTFALAFSIPQFAVYLDGITGGSQGLALPAEIGILGLSVGGSSSGSLLLSAGCFIAVALLTTLLLERSAGRKVLWVGEAEISAAVFGVRTTLTKVGVWTWASALGGLSGALFALTVGFLSPGQFEAHLGIFLFVGAVIAGTRSVWGALLGGLLVGTMPSQLQDIVPAEATGILFGAILFAGLVAGRGGVSRLIERELVSRVAVRLLGRAEGP